MKQWYALHAFLCSYKHSKTNQSKPHVHIVYAIRYMYVPSHDRGFKMPFQADTYERDPERCQQNRTPTQKQDFSVTDILLAALGIGDF